MPRFHWKSRVKTKTLLQYAETECGLVALAILFHYYATPVDVQGLREKAGLSRDGCRASTLISLAEQAGFTATAYSLSIDEVRTLSEPVIAYWRFSHYIVIERLVGEKVYINDPACGRHTITLDEFDQGFTGIVIHLTPPPTRLNQSAAPSKPGVISALLSASWREFAMIVLCLMVGGALPLVVSGLSAAFVNQVLMQNHLDWLHDMMALTAVFTLIYMLIQVANQWHQFKLAMKLSFLAVGNVFSRALSWPLLTYTLRPKSELLAVLSQIEASTSTLLTSVSSMLATALTVTILLVCLFTMNTNLMWITLALSLTCFVMVSVLGVIKKPLEMSAKQADIQWAGASLSAFNHLETVALTGMQSQVQSQWLHRLKEKLNKQIQVDSLTAFQTAITQFYQASILPMTVIFGLKLLQSAQLSVGGLLAYASLSVLLNRQMVVLMEAIKSSQTAITDFERSKDVANLPVDPRFAQPEMKVDVSTPPVITASALTFYFNRTAKPVIHDISLDIQPYQHIALVGSTGSGKSTLASLLMGLYQPDAGVVQYHGQSIRDWHPNQLAAMTAVVSQDSPLFTATLLENLTGWRESLPMEAVHAAIQQTGLSDLVARRGLTMSVSANGANLSGGEKQRIHIARAILQNTPVLILDEATSALDTETEALLMQQLRQLKKTVIFVAHRLSTVIHCDQILVLQAGTVCESGTHESLMKAGGYYYSLYQQEVQHASTTVTR